MSQSSYGSGVWRGFSAFQVFGDHLPMGGFKLVTRIRVEESSMMEMLAGRASSADVLDPELGSAVLRASLGLMRNSAVQCVYANVDGAVAMLSTEGIRAAGDSIRTHDRLVSMFSSRLALLVGEEMVSYGEVFEFPNLTVAKRAFSAVMEETEETTHLRTALRLGAQLNGRGHSVDLQGLTSLGDQANLLTTNSVDVDGLPPWWWRGMLARRSGAGIEVLDDLPEGEAFAGLLDI